MQYEFQKQHPGDKIWWVIWPRHFGIMRFSFDKKKVFELFKDYPHALTEEQKAIFDKENPNWAKLFSSRK